MTPGASASVSATAEPPQPRPLLGDLPRRVPRMATWRSCQGCRSVSMMPRPRCVCSHRRRGEHTDPIVQALGYSAERIAGLRQSKAIS